MAITPQEALGSYQLREVAKTERKTAREKDKQGWISTIDHGLRYNPEGIRWPIPKTFRHEITNIYKQKGWYVSKYKNGLRITPKKFNFWDRIKELFFFWFGKDE